MEEQLREAYIAYQEAKTPDNKDRFYAIIDQCHRRYGREETQAMINEIREE